jgi:hypothetical protein
MKEIVAQDFLASVFLDVLYVGPDFAAKTILFIHEDIKNDLL